MKRIIKNFDAATASERALIREQYPLGVESEDLLSLRMGENKYVQVLEVFTPEAICLFRMHPEVLQQLEEQDWDMEELDEAALAMELAEQRILRAAEAEAEALEQREMTVEVDEDEEEA